MDRFILNFTPTGMIPTREMTPHVPTQPAEIVDQVGAAVAAGANMVHLHARDSVTHRPTSDKEVYAQIVSGVRRRHPDLVICLSTSGRDFPEFLQRSECLDLRGPLKPDMASLTLSSLNFNNQASVNSPEMITALAARMAERGIKPELEVFDLGMINYSHYLIRKGFIKPPYYYNLILGNIACAQATMMSLGLMINELPDGAIWSVGGIGKWQLKMNAMGLVGGGGVRVGLEDNIWFDLERTELATNLGLVQRVVEIGAALGRRPYSLSEVRALVGVT